jgi:hypothetical protein
MIPVNRRRPRSSALRSLGGLRVGVFDIPTPLEVAMDRGSWVLSTRTALLLPNFAHRPRPHRMPA